jgi:hypothetical protein
VTPETPSTHQTLMMMMMMMTTTTTEMIFETSVLYGQAADSPRRLHKMHGIDLLSFPVRY